MCSCVVLSDSVSRHIKGSKERYLLGQSNLQIFGVTPLSSYKTILKQQLNGEIDDKMRWKAKLHLVLAQLCCFPIQCLEEC